MPRRALVTGATGFVGRPLVRILCDRGWSVRALVPPPERASAVVDPRAEVVEGDITSPASLRGCMDGVDGVFHLAGLVASWVPDPAAFVRVNVGGTEHVIDEALRARVPRFVFTSSISGIGVRPGETVREDSPPGRVFGVYEASKAEAERRVTSAVRERGLPGIILIPSIILGPGDVRNAGQLLLAFCRGEFPGTFAEKTILPVVGVEDVARAHLLAYERGRIGERYIVSSEDRPWGELMGIASQYSGTPMPSRRIGPTTLWLASRLGQAKSRITHRAPALPPWVADFMLTGARMDASKSVQELGMTYTPIKESIHSAIDWFHSARYLPAEPKASGTLNRLPIENPLEGPRPGLRADEPRREGSRKRRGPSPPAP